jgi:trimeric autotransporter adhesin
MQFNNPASTKNMTTLHFRKSIGRSPLRRGLPRVQPIWIIRGFLLIPLALAWFALSPAARAVSPAPDGGYPNFNTAEGANALFSLTTGISNTANGYEALFSNKTGNTNTATGSFALYFNTAGANTATGFQALYSNTTGGANTANGDEALFRNNTGSYNTANGTFALFSNTGGTSNTAGGYSALYSNTTGNYNTANGVEALFTNTTGSDNTANGVQALYSNTTGSDNTAIGVSALFSNTTGSQNAATGSQALYSNKTGFSNTASGFSALYFNTSGVGNAADGTFALYHNTTGGNNTAMGNYTLLSNTVGNNNTAVGSAALEYSTGANNIALGNQAGFNLTTGSNNIDIGAQGVAGESGKIRIGKGASGTFISGIYNKTVASGVGVIVDSTGHLGTVQSSARYKEAIKPMDKASEAILALQPVTFRYKHELDPDGVPQFGLVAEQVEKVNPDLVVCDEEGKVMTVRYEAVNAMLLNEFLKEHRKVEEQESTIDQLKAAVAKQQDAFGSKIAQQQKQIEALAAGLQKVSAGIELNKAAPTQVADSR